MGLQSCGSPNFENFGTPNLGVPGQNDIWVLALWPGPYNIIMGRWWLPPSPSRGESYESMFAHGSFVHQKCCNYTLTNLLFCLSKSVWIIYLLVILPSPHPGAPTRPFTSKVLRTREHAQLLVLSLFSPFGLIIESIKRFGDASQNHTNNISHNLFSLH
jgi:hypothetical protein